MRPNRPFGWIVIAALSFGLVPVAFGQSCREDLNGDGVVDSPDLALLLAAWGPCLVSIDSFTPPQGASLGGTTLTITGFGVGTATGVTVGGVACTGFTVLSSSSVLAVTPPGAIGPAAVAVVTPQGTITAATPFQYVQASILAVTPPTGGYNGGTAITITGNHLNGVTGVRVGGVPATNVVRIDSNTVTAVTPPGSVGTVAVTITTAKGTATAAGAFTYAPVNVPGWATLLEAMPDPAVVTDASRRQGIEATGFAWRVRDDASQIEMVLVPPGTFNMGCSASNQYNCESGEIPVHAVTLTAPFYIGRYEVTQAQWTAVMGSNPSGFTNASGQVPAGQVPLRPVERVSWNMIQAFNAATGLRLPTEAEWEYAYRSGTTTAFHPFSGHPSGTNDDTLVGNIAWFTSNSNSQTRPVGGRQANALGLHDMSGNVSEWVEDIYDGTYYAWSPPVNPAGPVSGSVRGLRGGSWISNSGQCRSSLRGSGTASQVNNNFGFRAARTP